MEHGGYEGLAKAIGVTPTFIRNIEACRELPSKKVCKYFDLVPVKEIRYRYEYLPQRAK